MNIYQTIEQMKSQRQTIYDLKIRVTYYARVSTQKDEQTTSIENQVEHFEKLIHDNPNWEYTPGYVDRIRGEHAANRENFMRMIEDSNENKFDLILTKEISRFARNTVDSLTYTRELFRHGVGVLFLNDNLCTVEGDSELRLTIMSGIAQDEVRKLSERIKFGHAQSIKKGTVMGNSRIYGYDKDNGKLVVNEKEAEMVKLIFDLYGSGKFALRAIERILYEKGYRSRNGNKIQHVTIGKIITNPKYKGYYCGNKVKIADYRTKEQVFLPEKEWLMYKDETGEIVPEIIDEHTWNTANKIFANRSDEVKNQERGQKTTSVLSGKIICKHHNMPMWRTSYSHRLHKGENVYQWICSVKKREGANNCPTFAIMEHELYEIFNSFFISLIDNIDDYIETFISVYKQVNNDGIKVKDINKLKSQIDALEFKKKKLLELYLDETLSKDDYKKMNDSLNDELSNYKEKLNIIQVGLSSRNDLESDLNLIKKKLSEFSLKSSNLTNEQVDDFIVLMIERIEVEHIENDALNLTILLKNGGLLDTSYKRTNVRSSGHTIKKMIDAYKNQ